MIVSPRAEPIIDVLRKEGNGFIPIDEVFLYRRAGAGSPYRKIIYWKRGEDAINPPQPKLRSFAIVPEMIDAVTKGYAIYGNTFKNAEAANAWRAFDRKAQTTGSFGTYNSNVNGDNRYVWSIITFPEPRLVQGWSLQFEYTWSSFWLAIEGRALGSNTWIRIFESTISPVNSGRFDAITTPMECTAVRILTDFSSYPVRSCQLFDACAPLVPVTLEDVIVSSEINNYDLHRCFTEQSNAFTHGTVAWYRNGGDWQSNRDLYGTRDQNRFFIKFSESKLVNGFSVGGLSNYYSHYCYANCLLIEGRRSASDYWQPLAEIEFDPAEQRTRYFDFEVDCVVSELRITVQDVTHGNNASDNTAGGL